MKGLLIVLLCTIAYASASAQDWRTVRTGDTVFFRRDHSPKSVGIDSSALRSMWIDSAAALAGDSIFFFFRGIRVDTPFSTSCQDTLAPSWMGPHMVRKQDGTEHYFNSRGDTITFRTRAGLGESWTLAKDGLGRSFQATVASAGVRIVDGVPDSVKTISIQAFSGGVPVADPYNSRFFEIGKSGGWLNTLDLFRFPNGLGGSGYGIGVSSVQERRLPRSFGYWNAGGTDLQWRYRPGNEFITTRNYGVPNLLNGKDPVPTLGGNEVITFDSVLTFASLAPGKAAVTFFTRRRSHLWRFVGAGAPNGFTDTTFLESFVHTDTVKADAGIPVRLLPLYESRSRPLAMGPPAGFDTRYFLDSLADGRFSLEEVHEQPPYSFIHTGGCWKWSASSPDPEARSRNWVQDFGTRLSFRHYASPNPMEYDREEVTYANLPGLIWGRKRDITALKIGEMPAAGEFYVFPNPADKRINVSAARSAVRVQLRLSNLAGQCVREASFLNESTIRTDDLMPGLYFLEVSGAGFYEVRKVIIQH